MRGYEKHEFSKEMAKPFQEETTVEGDVFRAIQEGTTPVETPPDERTRVTVEEIQRLRRMREREEARPIEPVAPAASAFTAVSENPKS